MKKLLLLMPLVLVLAGCGNHDVDISAGQITNGGGVIHSESVQADPINASPSKDDRQYNEVPGYTETQEPSMLSVKTQRAEAATVLKKFFMSKSCDEIATVTSAELYERVPCDSKDFIGFSKVRSDSMFQSCVLQDEVNAEHKDFVLDASTAYSFVFQCTISDGVVQYFFLKENYSSYKIVNLADDTTKKDAQEAIEAQVSKNTVDSVTANRRNERLTVASGALFNSEYNPQTTTVDKRDESAIWDTRRDEIYRQRRDGYVEKVNDRGELVVSTVVGVEDQKILNLFHVIPLYGGYIPYSSDLDACQRTQQLEYLKMHITGKKIGVYNDVQFCGKSPRIFYPDLLQSLGADSSDSKVVLGGVSLVFDNGYYPKSLALLLAEEGYLKTGGCGNDADQIKRAVEIAKVKQKGFWGTCK